MRAEQQDTSAKTGVASATTLLRVLTFWDLVVYGFTYVSPTGPWATYGFAYSLSGGLPILVFAIAIVMLSFTAWSYAEMSNEVTGAGSAYAYARYSMGEFVGFLAGWMVLFDYLLIPALMYALSAISLSVFTPTIPRWIWILGLAVYNITASWFGVKTSARLNFFNLMLQFGFLVVVLAGAIYVMKTRHMPMFTSAGWWRQGANVGGILSSTSICVMSFLGFDAITTLASEVKAEHKHLVGRAVLLSLLLLGGLAIFNVWILADLSRNYHFADLAAANVELIRDRISPSLALVVTVAGGITGVMAILPPMLTGVARVLYAMALDGDLPKPLSRVHPRHGVPHVAVMSAGLISLAVAIGFMNNFDILTSMVNIGAITAFVAVNLSVLIVFFIRKHERRGLAHLIIPVLGVATLLAVASQMSWIALVSGLAWLVVGIIIYFARRLRPGGKSAGVASAGLSL